MRESLVAQERLQKILLNDKIKSYDGFIGIINNDIKNILNQYMEIKSIDSKIDVDISNDYVLNINVKAINICVPNTI